MVLACSRVHVCLSVVLNVKGGRAAVGPVENGVLHSRARVLGCVAQLLRVWPLQPIVKVRSIAVKRWRMAEFSCLLAGELENPRPFSSPPLGGTGSCQKKLCLINVVKNLSYQPVHAHAIKTQGALLMKRREAGEGRRPKRGCPRPSQALPPRA
jgi:hypothetical protein